VAAGRLLAYGAVIKVGATFPVGANPVLSIRGSNVAVHGLTVDGNSLADRLVTVRDESANVRFFDCEFRYAAQQATETDLNTVGLRIEGDCSNIDVERCYFHHITAGGNSGLAQFARGILISDPNSAGVTTNVKVRGCTFTDITFTNISTDADAICIQNWTDNTWLLVDGCFFKNLNKRAVKIQSPGVTVSNCIIENDYTGADGVNGTPDPQVYAALSVYASDCLIANNNIVGGSWFHGIDIGVSNATTSRVTVTGNRISGGSGATMTGSAGIRVYGDNTCSEFVIANNYVGRFATGVWLSTAASGIVVSGNQVNGYNVASTIGVLIDGQSSVQPTRLAISGNSFEGLARYGIETSVVPNDMTAVGNMGGRTGFEIISGSAFTSFAATSRRTYAAANGGSGSFTAGADGIYGSNLPQGTVAARVVKTVTPITYSTSMTPDAKLGDWQAITVTNGTAMTIGAPTNPPTSSQSQRLAIEVYNNSGGVMGAVTWDAATPHQAGRRCDRRRRLAPGSRGPRLRLVRGSRCGHCRPDHHPAGRHHDQPVRDDGVHRGLLRDVHDDDGGPARGPLDRHEHHGGAASETYEQTWDVSSSSRSIIGLDEAKTFLRITGSDDDEQLRDVLEAASDMCERYTRKVWRRTTVTAEIHSGGVDVLYLRQAPVVSVTTVVDTGVTLAATSYTIDLPTGRLFYGDTTYQGWWTPGQDNISVTYVTGPPSGIVPAYIRGGMLELVEHLWSSRRGGSNLPRKASGGEEFSNKMAHALPWRVQEMWGCRPRWCADGDDAVGGGRGRPRGAMRATTGYRSPYSGSSGITVFDGPEYGLTEEHSESYLVIGWAGDPDSPEDSGQSRQTTGPLAANAGRPRDEEGTINCRAVSQIGDASLTQRSVKDARDACLAVIATVEAALRTDPTLGLVPTLSRLVAEMGGTFTPKQYANAGIVCEIDFQVTYRARI
jgi:hypothetical protein